MRNVELLLWLKNYCTKTYMKSQSLSPWNLGLSCWGVLVTDGQMDRQTDNAMVPFVIVVLLLQLSKLKRGNIDTIRLFTNITRLPASSSSSIWPEGCLRSNKHNQIKLKSNGKPTLIIYPTRWIKQGLILEKNNFLVFYKRDEAAQQSSIVTYRNF